MKIALENGEPLSFIEANLDVINTGGVAIMAILMVYACVIGWREYKK